MNVIPYEEQSIDSKSDLQDMISRKMRSNQLSNSKNRLFEVFHFCL